MNFNDDTPIFVQLAQQLEEGVLSGAYPEDTQIPSITDFSVMYKINPATALKAVNSLVDAGLLYKKRGVGMFVEQGAREKLQGQRREKFYRDYVERIVREARNLGLSQPQLAEMIERGYKDVD